MTLGCPLSIPGASPLSMPQKWHKCSLLSAYTTWTDTQGSSRALLQGDVNRLPFGNHLRPDPMIVGDLFASLGVHGVLHSQRDMLSVGGSDCTHPLFTDSNHGFSCFFEKTTKVLNTSKTCWAIFIFGRKYLVWITKCLKNDILFLTVKLEKNACFLNSKVGYSYREVHVYAYIKIIICHSLPL